MDSLPGVPAPRIPAAAWRLFPWAMLTVVAVLVLGATLSLSGAAPPWAGWALAFCLLPSLVFWEFLAFLRLGMLAQQRTLIDSVVGSWSLRRGEVEVGGWLVPDDPNDAHLFAYKIIVGLSEDTGRATVAVWGGTGQAEKSETEKIEKIVE